MTVPTSSIILGLISICALPLVTSFVVTHRDGVTSTSKNRIHVVRNNPQLDTTSSSSSSSNINIRVHNTQLFSSQSLESTNNLDDTTQNRRKFLVSNVIGGAIAASTAAALPPLTTPAAAAAAAAEEGDMTSQMFNEDGSLKASAMNGLSGTEIEAKSKTVSVMFPTAEASNDATAAIVNIDGNYQAQQDPPSLDDISSKIKTSYQIPDKWTPAPEYLDTLLSVREKACDHITVFQVPGLFKDNSMLEKATTVGVAKALNFASTGPGVFPKALAYADIVGGRKVNKEIDSSGSGEKKQKYYEFDLAVAPDTCGQSAENLNLGFCPYDTIVLVSATIINEKMMVCTVTCNKDMWKRANADLKRVRGSFFVETQA